MLEHTDTGAVGVVLNRPMNEEPPDQLASWTAHLSAPRDVCFKAALWSSMH